MCNSARAAAAFALLLAGAAVLCAAEPSAPLVPWELAEPDADIDSPLVLFWIPATPGELRRSELLTSHALATFSARCVAMRVVGGADNVRLARLAEDEQLPVAVLTDRDGAVLGRVTSDRGFLEVAEVEDLVGEEIERRAADADERLDRARDYAEAEETELAIVLYESVWAERCMCPRQARDARKALRKLKR